MRNFTNSVDSIPAAGRPGTVLVIRQHSRAGHGDLESRRARKQTVAPQSALTRSNCTTVSILSHYDCPFFPTLFTNTLGFFPTTFHKHARALARDADAGDCDIIRTPGRTRHVFVHSRVTGGQPDEAPTMSLASGLKNILFGVPITLPRLLPLNNRQARIHIPADSYSSIVGRVS